MDATERLQGNADMTKERPILFNGAMVRAILAGAKTQTRRVVKPQPVFDTRFRSRFRVDGRGSMSHRQVSTDAPAALLGEICPFGQPGDRLWVRETWCHAWDDERDQWSDPERYHYRADGIEVVHVDDGERSPWCPSIHMPRRACRLLLEITDVRVERLQEISEADAMAEGADVHVLPDIRLPRTHPRAGRPMVYADCREIFADLWDSTGGDWNSNPWVWAITFKRIDA